MPYVFIGIAIAAVAAAVIVRVALRRHARGKCRTLIAVAKAVLEDGFGSEIGGRNALDRLSEAAALRAKHGFTAADLGLDDDAAFDALFNEAVTAATRPSVPPVTLRGASAASDERSVTAGEMPAAPALDFEDEPTLTDIRVPHDDGQGAPTQRDAELADDDAPTVPGFRVPHGLLDERPDSDQEPKVNVDIFGSQRRDDLH